MNDAWKAASEDLYKAQQPQPGAPTDGAPQDGAPQDGAAKPGNENVQDVPFEEVKDDKG